MFSKTCEYALKALIFIARSSLEDKIVNIKSIAKNINSPEYFIAKILQDLSRKGFVNSIKGPNGGFFMDKKQYKTKMIDIVYTIDRDKVLKRCSLGLTECSEQNPCPLHDQYKEIKEKLEEILEKTKIIDLIYNGSLI